MEEMIEMSEMNEGLERGIDCEDRRVLKIDELIKIDCE